MTPPTLPLTTPLRADLLRGALELEATEIGIRPHRLPAWARAQAADPQILMAEAQPSGVRIVAATEATAIELVVLATRYGYRGAPARPDGVFDLLVDGALHSQASLRTATTVVTDMATGDTVVEAAQPEALRFDNLPVGPKTLEIWLPTHEALELVELRSDAPVVPVPADAPAWLHHGSSISHGSNATHPTGTWPAIAARTAGVALTNLGFGGGALLDPFTARTMRDTPADLLSIKMGINLVNADLMRLRAFGPAVHGFLDTVRDGHPDTPLLVITPILCPIHEDAPGPGAFDMEALARGELRFIATGDPAEVAHGRLTLAVIRRELERIVRERQATDPHLHLVDGLSLYGLADVDAHPLPDALHPDAATHRLMAERFVALAFGEGRPFA
ncbi:SGNH/GDSL hydrolase family protein [Demequina capsici]|uniref:SGNH/GDSL hydrolase family protein n=1 Tax=Demequina capsici TaxID=3075620 RepID=A0AA96F7J3_9MICO|nr:SGNH/GDSL hydrolase family protein [Demequina sp. OYTSA14]WNM24190.1 SGNH/GDSL hydrolase family protein [Demequina sp. OYTSA14]